LVDLSQGKQLITTKWVYKIKLGYGEASPKIKARLMARGFQ
jgi:hypothetical protein